MTSKNNAASLQEVMPFLLLAVAVFLAYANVYDNVFLFDDNLVITLNEYLHNWSTLGKLLTSSTTGGAHIAGGFYRPVQMLLYFIVFQISGHEPGLFHLLNVALHAANACLVFALGRRLNFNPWAAFLAALIWGLHPLHTEVITYISGTAEPLFTFFCLLGLIVLLPDFTRARILIVLPIFILALLSKENAVAFPVLACLCLFVVSKKRLKPQTYVGTWPFWLIGAVYLLWRMSAAGFDGPTSYSQYYQQHAFSTLQLYADHFSWRLYTFLATLPNYLHLIIWPEGLHMERSFPVFDNPWNWQVGAGALLCAAALGQIVWGRGRRGLPLSWGLLWFGAVHFPNTGLAFPMNAQFLEHWMYLPSIGLFLGMAESVAVFLRQHEWPKAKPVAAAVVVIVAGLLGLKTFEQNTVWSDAFTFYGHIFKYNEPSPRAHNNLALAYMDRDDYAAAVAEFNKAIQETDTYAETRYNLALALLQLPDQQDEISKAIANLQRAVEIDPDFYRAWGTLASIYDHIGERKRAKECGQKAQTIMRRMKQ